MVRTNQGGSVLGFIIVAVTLAALFIGGVVFFHSQTTPHGDTSTPPPVIPQPMTPAPTHGPSSNPSTSQTVTPPVASADPTVLLPRTGPEETVGALIALASLTLAVVSYARSRRSQLSL